MACLVEGDSKEEVPGSNPCGRGGDKDALYRWEPVGGFFLNARGRTASIDLSFRAYHQSRSATARLVGIPTGSWAGESFLVLSLRTSKGSSGRGVTAGETVQSRRRVYACMADILNSAQGFQLTFTQVLLLLQLSCPCRQLLVRNAHQEPFKASATRVHGKS
eukprot:1161373-Pelagomonas_calceolata.AAC.17